MVGTLQRFWKDESGPELVEWAVVTIILLLAAVVLYIAVGKALGTVICSVKCWIQSVTDPKLLDQGANNDRAAICDDRSDYNCTDEPGNP